MHEVKPEEINREIKAYIRVFVTLMVLTVVTVAASYIPATVTFGIILALIIASVKGGLVGAFFMHLRHEGKGTMFLIVSCFFLFIVLLLIPLLTTLDSSGVS